MNKGIFSGLVAATAIILIGAIILATSANVKNSSNEDFASKILEIKKEWNNARYLVDKSISDAVADTVNTSTCSFVLDQAKIQNYAADAIENIPDCTFSNFQAVSVPVPPNSTGVTVSLTINCSKKIGSEFEIKKFEKTVAFAKKVELIYIPAPESCTITITDSQSDIVEVQKTV